MGHTTGRPQAETGEHCTESAGDRVLIRAAKMEILVYIGPPSGESTFTFVIDIFSLRLRGVGC